MRIKNIAIFNPKGIKPNDYINYIDTSSVEDGKLICIQKLYSEIPSRAQRAISMNDILISSVRPILKHNYYVNKKIENCIASTDFIQIRVISNTVLPQFLYYYLTEENKIKHYQSIAETSQSTFPSFNKEVIEEMNFPNISLDGQQHIVDILGSIDEKVENNMVVEYQIHYKAYSLYGVKSKILSPDYFEIDTQNWGELIKPNYDNVLGDDIMNNVAPKEQQDSPYVKQKDLSIRLKTAN